MRKLIEEKERELGEARVKPMATSDPDDARDVDKNYRKMIREAISMVGEASTQVGQIDTQLTILDRLAKKAPDDKFLRDVPASVRAVSKTYVDMHGELEKMKKKLQQLL